MLSIARGQLDSSIHVQVAHLKSIIADTERDNRNLKAALSMASQLMQGKLRMSEAELSLKTIECHELEASISNLTSTLQEKQSTLKVATATAADLSAKLRTAEDEVVLPVFLIQPLNKGVNVASKHERVAVNHRMLPSQAQEWRKAMCLEKENLEQDIQRLERLLKLERADKLQNASAIEGLQLELLGAREKVGRSPPGGRRHCPSSTPCI